MSRDIDAKVAKLVMGWAEHPSDFYDWKTETGDGVESWFPSIDPAAAMQVVERIHEMFPGACVSFGLCSTTDMKKANSDPQPDNCDGPMCGVGSIEWYTEDPVECHLYTWTEPYGTGSKTAAACLALCKAALRAVAGDEGGAK